MREHSAVARLPSAEGYPITRVAVELGEDQNWLSGIAGEMEPQDGLIWVYGPGDEETLAFTDFGIEQLQEIIAIHRDKTD